MVDGRIELLLIGISYAYLPYIQALSTNLYTTKINEKIR
uniref:Uncharacterized protein n=1 Tax=Siphoviridae sp. ctYOF2 TaxID=2826376 RepID=A0A8S5MAT1_9CAUD|nr:MAG TPA: hypothetical protein [Siphoviridae sp. ctYOF2]DAN48182.1 MAG TPA: hypothetical protein [Caudoviricetes sp.]DAX75435.1 MAG TPA: hypothetical protein [Caudoviricetes sp.]